ncbi:MAG: hypothetical protein HY446_00060 [Candidatus Niyogibacteria bacterium]|nr:hypothetical protein [Candidatus Niyogibacteria bacterium]
MYGRVYEKDAQTLVRYLRTFASGVFCAAGFTFAYVFFYKVAVWDFSLQPPTFMVFDIAMVYSGFSLAWFAIDRKYYGACFGVGFAALNATFQLIVLLIILHPERAQEGEFWLLPVFEQGLFAAALICLTFSLFVPAIGVLFFGAGDSKEACNG